MLLPPESLEIEVEGGQSITQVLSFPGLMDMFFRIRSDPEEGKGRVVVRDISGRVSTSCEFSVGDWEVEPVSIEDSWATMSSESVGTWVFDSVRLRIGLVNDYGELMGSKVWPEILLTGGEWASPLLLNDGGTLSGDIRATGTHEVVSVVITVNSLLLTSFELKVEGQGESSQSGADMSSEEDESSGCASSNPTQKEGGLLILFTCLLIYWSRVRQSLPRRAGRLA